MQVKKLAVWVAVAAIMGEVSFAAGRVEDEIAYDPSIGAFGTGTLTLPRNWSPECVAGAISVSSIGDPDCDVLGHRHSQRVLLGPEMDYSRMNPILSIKPGMAPLLCTHATGDKVVPGKREQALEMRHVAVAYGRGGEIPDLELVATMKFTGQNTLCYPVCWYGGSWARSTRRART